MLELLLKECRHVSYHRHSLRVCVAEVLDAPTSSYTPLVIKSNVTVTLLPAANNPSRALGRQFQYTSDNVTWWDMSALLSCVYTRY